MAKPPESRLRMVKKRMAARLSDISNEAEDGRAAVSLDQLKARKRALREEMAKFSKETEDDSSQCD